MTCKTCQHAVLNPSDNSLYCRRYPPQPFLVDVKFNDLHQVMGTQQVSTFPLVNPSQWCGEFVAKVKHRDEPDNQAEETAQ